MHIYHINADKNNQVGWCMLDDAKFVYATENFQHTVMHNIKTSMTVIIENYRYSCWWCSCR